MRSLPLDSLKEERGTFGKNRRVRTGVDKVEMTALVSERFRADERDEREKM